MPVKGLTRYKLLPAFVLALVPLFFLPLFLPTLRLTFFAPYIIVVCYKRSLQEALWHASLSGMCIDLLSSTSFFGFLALSNCLTTGILYSQTRNFFEDKPSTLPLMTFFFSFLSTSLYALLVKLSGQTIFYSLHWALTDLILMPLLDAAYAFLWYSLPFQLYYRLTKLRRYLRKKKS